MIEQCSLKLLEQAINRYIDLSRSHREKLSEFDHKIIKLVVRPINYHFYLRFEDQRVCVDATTDAPIDTTISATPLGFVQMGLLPADKLRSLFGQSIEIDGDVILGQDIKHFFETMDIDWEAHLSHFSNDFIAQQVSQGVQKGKTFSQDIIRSLTHTLGDLLQYDSKTLPQRESVEAFCHDVDELRLDVDRLEAKFHLSRRPTAS